MNEWDSVPLEPMTWELIIKEGLAGINEGSQISSPGNWENNDALVKTAKWGEEVALRREAEVKTQASGETPVQMLQ